MDYYVLMYSRSQDCFHIESVSVMLDKNVRMFLRGKGVDYVPLSFAPTIEELREIKNSLIRQKAGS